MTQLPTHFDVSAITPVDRFVVWIDVMGSRERLTRSLPMSANFVGKLHCALISAHHAPVSIHPMNDGAFLLFDDVKVAKSTLRDVFALVYDENARTPDKANFFMPRAGVAYGPVVTGAQLKGASTVLDSQPAYRDTLLLGAPVAQAFEAESRVGPYGVYVHETARTLGPGRWTGGAYLRYWNTSSGRDGYCGSKLLAQASSYLVWSRDRSHEYSYPVDAIDKHLMLAKEFFRR